MHKDLKYNAGSFSSQSKYLLFPTDQVQYPQLSHSSIQAINK